MFISVWLVGSTIAVLLLFAIGSWSLWDYNNELRDCVKRSNEDVDILNGRLRDQRAEVSSAFDAKYAAQREVAKMKDELVNREELVVRMNQDEDRIFEVIKAEVDRLSRERADNLTALADSWSRDPSGQ